MFGSHEDRAIVPEERALAQEARAWPFVEARKLVARIAGAAPDKG